MKQIVEYRQCQHEEKWAERGGKSFCLIPFNPCCHSVSGGFMSSMCSMSDACLHGRDSGVYLIRRIELKQLCVINKRLVGDRMSFNEKAERCKAKSGDDNYTESGTEPCRTPVETSADLELRSMNLHSPFNGMTFIF